MDFPEFVKGVDGFSSVEGVVRKRLVRVEGLLSELERLEDVDGERFNLLLSEWQGLKEFAGFVDASRELERLKGVGDSRAVDVEARINFYKAWWLKLNQHVVQSYARLEDRRSREGVVDKVIDRLSLGDVHRVMRGEVVDVSGEVKGLLEDKKVVFDDE